MKTISCREAVTFILKKEEGRLSIGGRIQLWRHLAICSLCRAFSSQSSMINRLLRRKHDPEFHRLTEEEKESIIRNILNKEI